MKFIKIIMLFCICMLLSCGKSADVRTDYGTETINGFVVNWDSQVTEEQHDYIVEILNDMVKVNGGTFIMGATSEQLGLWARDNEYPAHYVELSDYYIRAHELSHSVSLKEFNAYFNLGNWNEAEAFVKYLRELTGLEFDLPTEAQWEYAARGGDKSQGFIFPGSDDYKDVWSHSSSTPSTHPNELGLFNMADGNREWCKDNYSAYSSVQLEKDPFMYDDSKRHVVRGGCWNSSTRYDYESTWWKDEITCSSGLYQSCHTTSRGILYERFGEDQSNYVTLRPVINITAQ